MWHNYNAHGGTAHHSTMPWAQFGGCLLGAVAYRHPVPFWSSVLACLWATSGHLHPFVMTVIIHAGPLIATSLEIMRYTFSPGDLPIKLRQVLGHKDDFLWGHEAVWVWATLPKKICETCHRLRSHSPAPVPARIECKIQAWQLLLG